MTKYPIITFEFFHIILFEILLAHPFPNHKYSKRNCWQKKKLKKKFYMFGMSNISKIFPLSYSLKRKQKIKIESFQKPDAICFYL